MKSYHLILLGGAVFAAAATLSVAGEAQVASCTYLAADGNGNSIQSSVKASKKENACERARRDCNRELERAYRQGDAAPVF